MNKYLVLLGALSIIATPIHAAYAQDLKGFELEHSSHSVRDIPSLTKPGEVNLFTEEPSFEKVTLLKIEPPMSLRERVDRLLYGIYTDIPPEYDHFGYEIRRYMAGIGNVQSLSDPAFIKKQLKNINTSKVILEYWGKELNKEINEIERIIEEKNDASSTRSTFKYNRGIVNAFLVESESWINNNKMALEYLEEIGPTAYKYNERKGTLIFKNKQHLKRFASIYKSKREALKEMRGYLPYRMMIY
jgi:hypothetical protein